MTEAQKEQERVRREHDESIVIAAIRDLGGNVRFKTIHEKLGVKEWDMRRLDRTLQRLKKHGALKLEYMRWSVV